MNKRFIVLVAVLVLSFSIIAIAGTILFFQSTEEEPEPDTPEFSGYEVIAIVKLDLIEQAHEKGKGEEYFSSPRNCKATYLGQGKWTGSCQYSWLSRSGWDRGTINWNFFEKSQTTEILR